MTVHTNQPLTPAGLGANGVSQPHGIWSLQALREAVDAGRITKVFLAAADNVGRPLGEHLPARRFLEHLGDHTAFRIPLMVWQLDIEQDLNPDLEHVGGLSTGGPDCYLKPDLSTLRVVPWMTDTAFVICDPALADGTLLEIAPRQVLKRQLARLAEHGATVQCASELEFFLFEQSYEDGWRSRYQELSPASRYQGAYDPLVAISNETFIDAVVEQMELAGVPIEALSCEYGLGQQEINLTHTDALEMADRHFIYKFGVKAIATRMGKSATFMAKWDAAGLGSSCHIHTSLWSVDGSTPLGDSELFDGFLAGLVGAAREMCLLYAPNLNSYRRFQPNSFAPTTVACGNDNRTLSFRVVGDGSHRRVENRIPGADVNPYVAIAAAVAAGVDGIERRLPFPELIDGDGYARTDLPQLPTSLPEAIDLFASSDTAKSSLGAEVHAHLLTVGRGEMNAFLTQTVTDWERRRYFERT
ncbi:glutamine synthetase [Mycobacterium frederiksbergense]|uniref:Glutamine synthetase n=1 Tax=Mycolicibacterium frederiksbergense TaxID=117567 RepID=A0ABT6KZ10_9MYCO|nr:glutamine synthetase family protein [Mycolicibacterium frederiksbergense]MDH6195556.1 glutamine synthetase [Mycolicibacterium frederiksbergense]